MYEITITTNFSSAHSLVGYKGKCESLHGHNWKIQVTLKGIELDKIGLLYDFSDLKKLVNDIIIKIDHKNLNEITPFNKTNPSSENIAKYLYQKVKYKIQNTKCNVSKVTVWESDTSYATYYENS